MLQRRFRLCVCSIVLVTVNVYSVACVDATALAEEEFRTFCKMAFVVAVINRERVRQNRIIKKQLRDNLNPFELPTNM